MAVEPPGEGWAMGRWAAAVATALAMVLTGSPAAAEHMVDTGWIHGGVSSEDEARAYPCTTSPLGGWERTGPVVCLAKQSDTWRLEASPEGSGCTYGPAGWHGSCVFDFDAGDHIRVWGTRGIGWTPFSVTWLHTGEEPDSAPSATPSSTPQGGESPTPTTSPTPSPGSTGTQSGDSLAANPSPRHDPAAPAHQVPSATPTPRDVAAPPDGDSPAADTDRVTPHSAVRRAWRGGAILLLIATGAMAIRILLQRRTA